MMTLRQVLAIARTEFRFAFRRGAPVAVTVVIGLLVGAGLLTQVIGQLPYATYLTTDMTPEQVQRWTANGFTLDEHAVFVREAAGDEMVSGSVLAWYVLLLGLVLLPVATIIAIPADRVFGVAELLHSTPLSGARYLAGKILGTLAAVLLVAASLLVLFLGVTEIVFFSLLHFSLSWNASAYLIKLSLLDGLPLLLWGTAIGILAGVLFRTRRAALFPGLLAGLLSVLFWLRAFGLPMADGAMLTDRVEYYLLQNYQSAATAMEARLLGQGFNLFGITAPIGFGQVLLMYLAILVVLGTAALIARLWLQWKENF
jgi:ABC-type transport system involved in multi-copper enzyme maturation permease subunit